MTLKPSDLKVGQEFYECQSGINLKATVVTPVVETTFVDGTRERKQWAWTAKRIDGSLVDYLSTEGFEHYGPKLYDSPQYMYWGCKKRTNL